MRESEITGIKFPIFTGVGYLRNKKPYINELLGKGKYIATGHRLMPFAMRDS